MKPSTSSDPKLTMEETLVAIYETISNEKTLVPLSKTTLAKEILELVSETTVDDEALVPSPEATTNEAFVHVHEPAIDESNTLSLESLS